MRRCFLLIVMLLGGLSGRLHAQTTAAQFGFDVGSVAKVVQGTDTLAQAWVGGLNTPQFSSIDLNGDGQLDLYAFDRETSRSYTFLNAAAAGGGRRWQYAPVYENVFPADLASWALLRDYDCDGRPDLFTYATGGNIRVYRNVAGAGGVPQFVLARGELDFALSSTFSININLGYYNLPAIQDINGDGRLDIVSYDFLNSVSIEIYLNTGTGSCTDLAAFIRTTNVWGGLSSCGDCASYQLGSATQCQARRTISRVNAVSGPLSVEHSSGHNILLLDLNGDGLLDVVDGRDNCPQLVRLLNSGTSNLAANFTYANTSSSFPAGAAIGTGVYPAAYSFDADFDGVPDLVVAPNQVDNSADRVTMRRTIRQFRNTSGSAGAVPSYAQVSDGFLQNDMLDVSEGAAPAFGDLDGDGLVDMLVGTQGDVANGYYRASLYYYRNVGTARRPVFRLVTDDYLGLAATAALTPTTKFETLRPALVDLNRDGALDLVYSVFTGATRLNFLLNKAPAGQPASFSPAQADYFRPQGAGGTGVIASSQGDTPCFFDVDGDGYVDLLLGTNDVNEDGASLRYFRNRGVGVATNSMFALANNDFGGLRIDNNRPANLSATVADFDGDGQPDLLTTDGGATLRYYSDLRHQPAQFIERTDLIYNSLTGQYGGSRLGQGFVLRFAAATAAINQDGTPELYVGTETGGIVSYLPRNRTVLASRTAAAQALALSVYPNPADPATAPTIETAQPTSLRLLDLAGRQLRFDSTPLRRRALSVSGLAAGVYLLQATAADGTTATQRLVVR